MLNKKKEVDTLGWKKIFFFCENQWKHTPSKGKVLTFIRTHFFLLSVPYYCRVMISMQFWENINLREHIFFFLIRSILSVDNTYKAKKNVNCWNIKNSINIINKRFFSRIFHRKRNSRWQSMSENVPLNLHYPNTNSKVLNLSFYAMFCSVAFFAVLSIFLVFTFIESIYRRRRTARTHSFIYLCFQFFFSTKWEWKKKLI